MLHILDEHILGYWWFLSRLWTCEELQMFPLILVHSCTLNNLSIKSWMTKLVAFIL